MNAQRDFLGICTRYRSVCLDLSNGVIWQTNYTTTVDTEPPLS